MTDKWRVMMKSKLIMIALVLGISFVQAGCSADEKTDMVMQGASAANLKSEDKEEIALDKETGYKKNDTIFTPRERHVYNANDTDKNLLLQFLNDEVPIINYEEEGKIVYFSDLDTDGIGPLDRKRYHIVDMDGDGRQDFCFTYPASRDVIRYNEKMECFELWLSELNKQFPIGNKQMYFAMFNTITIYSYLRYDEFANLLEERVYSVREDYDKEKDEHYTVYEIDFEPVSESEWKEATAYFFELKESAPEALSYQDLLSD
jgi:hypothetical protein